MQFQRDRAFLKLVCPWIIHFNRLFPCFSIINRPFWGIPIHGNPQLSLAIKQTRGTKHRKNLQKESQQNALMSNDFSMAPKPAAKSWPLSISQKQHVIICYNVISKVHWLIIICSYCKMAIDEKKPMGVSAFCLSNGFFSAFLSLAQSTGSTEPGRSPSVWRWLWIGQFPGYTLSATSPRLFVEARWKSRFAQARLLPLDMISMTVVSSNHVEMIEHGFRWCLKCCQAENPTPSISIVSVPSW